MSNAPRPGSAPRSSRRLARLLVILLVLVAPSRGAAQALRAPDTLSIRLGPILADVERAHPRLAAAHALARASRARVAGASRPADPVLQIGWMNYELPALRPMDAIGMVQLQLMQMVPVAGKLRLSGRIEGARANAVATRVDEVRLTLRVRTAMAFFDLYAAEGALRVSSETRRLLEDIATVADRMYQVGEAQQADVLRARVEVARMDEDIVRMHTMRVIEQAALNALLLRPADSPVGRPILPHFPETPAPLDSFVELADQVRPMLRAGMIEVDVADLQTRLADREIWPDLVVGVQYGQRGGLMGTERMGSLMVGASLPLFAGSRQLPMRTEARAMAAMAAGDLAAMRTETSGAIAATYATLQRSRRLAALYRASVLPQSEAMVASARAAYRVGGVPFMTLLEAQMTLNRYRQELFTLEADEGKAWAELEMLTGRNLLDTGSALPASRFGGTPR